MQSLDLAASGDLLKTHTIFGIVVEDQETERYAKGGGFSPLLGDPGIGWIPGDTHMYDASRAQFDDDEDAYRSEPHIVGSGKETTLPSPPPLRTAREPFVIHAAQASRLPLCDVTGHGFSTGKC